MSAAICTCWSIPTSSTKLPNASTNRGLLTPTVGEVVSKNASTTVTVASMVKLSDAVYGSGRVSSTYSAVTVSPTDT